VEITLCDVQHNDLLTGRAKTLSLFTDVFLLHVFYQSRFCDCQVSL